MYYVIFILVLGLLILVHEFGHFIVAKAFGIRVDEFAIGFPPRLLRIRRGETDYTLNLLFFGGFVKIFGENASSDKSAEHPDIRTPDYARSFAHKSRWAQSAVTLAGILFNVVFAWLALSVGYMVGIPTSVDHVGWGEVRDAHPMIVAVSPGSPAEKAGVKPEDTVETLETGNAKLSVGATADEVQNFIAAHQDESVILSVMRDGKSQTFLAKPIGGIVPDHKVIGIQLDDVGILKLPPHLALAEGAILTKQMTVAIAGGLWGLLTASFHGAADLKGVAGPIGIAGIGATAVAHGFVATILLTALISINLAIMNLLPIPGLDGGRQLFILIEAVRGKPVSEKLFTRLTLLGFGSLLLLMLVISYFDILRLVHPA